MPSIIGAQILGLELLEGEKSKTYTVEYTQGFILIDVQFNNTLPLRFILDTGAEHIILFKREITDILGMQYEKRINLMGADLERQVYAYITRDVPLKLSNTKSVRRDIIVLEEDFLHLEELTGETIHGIIGSRFFRGLAVELNYRKNKIVLHDASNFNGADDSKYDQIDIDIDQHKPYLQSRIIQTHTDTLDLNLLIDTGSALPFLLFLNTDNKLEIPEHYVTGNLGKGLGGNIEGYLSKIDHLELANKYVFNDIVTSFQKIDTTLNPATYRYRNGLVGNPLLERFNVIIDFVNAKMYLKPHKKFNKPFEYDKSGMVIYAFGPELNQYYVKSVVVGSPAYISGIREGDMIKKIGFWPASFFSLKGILKKMKGKNGKKIKMTMERKGFEYKTSLILEDFLAQE